MGSWGPFLEIIPAVLPLIKTEGKDRREIYREARGPNQVATNHVKESAKAD